MTKEIDFNKFKKGKELISRNIKLSETNQQWQDQN